jgi:hypothetical protein
MPLFVCDRRLRGYKTLPRAAAPWALDSGGSPDGSGMSREGEIRAARIVTVPPSVLWAIVAPWNSITSS